MLPGYDPIAAAIVDGTQATEAKDAATLMPAVVIEFWANGEPDPAAYALSLDLADALIGQLALAAAQARARHWA